MWGTTLENAGQIKATWLRHTALLGELPTPPKSTRGLRTLLEPALS
jgi:hypothetical protein